MHVCACACICACGRMHVCVVFCIDAYFARVCVFPFWHIILTHSRVYFVRVFLYFFLWSLSLLTVCRRVCLI
jgi:hypothetical protein